MADPTPIFRHWAGVLLCLAWACAAWAQPILPDSAALLPAPPDTLLAQPAGATPPDSARADKPYRYRQALGLKPASLRLGTDLLPLLLTAFDPDFAGASAHAGLSLADRLWLSADAGWENARRANPQQPDYRYHTQGSYWRLGIDYNLLYWASPQDALCLGLHYGRAAFSQTIDWVSVAAPPWPNAAQRLEANGARGSWLEARLTLQVRPFPRWQLEALLMAKGRLGTQGTAAAPNDLPGMGIQKARVRPAFGYRVCYVIDFR